MRAAAAIVQNICADGNTTATVFGKCGSQEHISFSGLFRVRRVAEGQLRAAISLKRMLPSHIRHVTSAYAMLQVL